MSAVIGKILLVIACAIGIVVLAHASRKPLTVEEHERVDTIVGDGPWEVPRPQSALIGAGNFAQADVQLDLVANEAKQSAKSVGLDVRETRGIGFSLVAP